jgi:hypothetical protein
VSLRLDSIRALALRSNLVPEPSPGETYDKLLVVLDQLAREALRLGDDAIIEWTGVARLDAIDLGEQLGLLSDVEATERRVAGDGAAGRGAGPATRTIAQHRSVEGARRQAWRQSQPGDWSHFAGPTGPTSDREVGPGGAVKNGPP